MRKITLESTWKSVCRICTCTADASGFCPGALLGRTTPASNPMMQDDPSCHCQAPASLLLLLSRDNDHPAHEGMRCAVVGVGAGLVEDPFEWLAGFEKPGIERAIAGRYRVGDLILIHPAYPGARPDPKETSRECQVSDANYRSARRGDRRWGDSG